MIAPPFLKHGNKNIQSAHKCIFSGASLNALTWKSVNRISTCVLREYYGCALLELHRPEQTQLTGFSKWALSPMPAKLDDVCFFHLRAYRTKDWRRSKSQLSRINMEVFYRKAITVVLIVVQIHSRYVDKTLLSAYYLWKGHRLITVHLSDKPFQPFQSFCSTEEVSVMIFSTPTERSTILYSILTQSAKTHRRWTKGRWSCALNFLTLQLVHFKECNMQCMNVRHRIATDDGTARL